MTDHSSDIPKESPRTILFQFVVFPLGIVAIAVGIFFLFGKLASDEQTVPDYLNEVRSGGRRERWQAAYQLSQLINVGEAKKYPRLAEDVMRVFVEAKNARPLTGQPGGPKCGLGAELPLLGIAWWWRRRKSPPLPA